MPPSTSVASPTRPNRRPRSPTCMFVPPQLNQAKQPKPLLKLGPKVKNNEHKSPASPPPVKQVTISSPCPSKPSSIAPLSPVSTPDLQSRTPCHSPSPATAQECPQSPPLFSFGAKWRKLGSISSPSSVLPANLQNQEPVSPKGPVTVALPIHPPTSPNNTPVPHKFKPRHIVPPKDLNNLIDPAPTDSVPLDHSNPLSTSPLILSFSEPPSATPSSSPTVVSESRTIRHGKQSSFSSARSVSSLSTLDFDDGIGPVFTPARSRSASQLSSQPSSPTLSPVTSFPPNGQRPQWTGKEARFGSPLVEFDGMGVEYNDDEDEEEDDDDDEIEGEKGHFAVSIPPAPVWGRSGNAGVLEEQNWVGEWNRDILEVIAELRALH